MARIVLVVTLIVVVSLSYSGSEARGVCGVNEYWEENRNTCEWTCNKECRFREDRCICSDHYYRKDGRCVPENECRSAGSEASGTCPGGVHDIWVADRKGVHNVKERSCDNKLILRHDDCICETGFYRKDGIHGPCVTAEECRNAGSEASGTCPGGVHDIWVADRKGVHNVKERSCDNELILRHDDCMCETGFYRKDGIHGPCVTAEECRNAGSKASRTCPGGVHDIWVGDRVGVHNVRERRCDNEPILRHDDCMCETGFYRKDGIHGPCVTAEECRNGGISDVGRQPHRCPGLSKLFVAC